ncbi:MAG: hypothetical protein ACKVHE_23370 [Planctomycetales bacterium]
MSNHLTQSREDAEVRKGHHDLAVEISRIMTPERADLITHVFAFLSDFASDHARRNAGANS